MSEQLIFELSSKPVKAKDRIQDWGLDHCFFRQNPWWVLGCCELTNYTRTEAIDELRKAMPEGYAVGASHVEIQEPTLFWQGEMDRVKGELNIQTAPDYPLVWWKRSVNQYCGIMVYFEEELFTLQEFLFYLVSFCKDNECRKLYIGGILEYES